MRGKLIQNPYGIDKLDKGTTMVLLRYRPSISNTMQLLKKAPNLKYVFLSSSANLKATSPKAMTMIREKKIELGFIRDRPVRLLKKSSEVRDIEVDTESV